MLWSGGQGQARAEDSSPPLHSGSGARHEQAPQSGVIPKDLRIEKIDQQRFRVGQVTVDRLARSVSFPATFQAEHGRIRHAVVSDQPANPEALLTTPAAPRDIHLATLLLGVKPSGGDATPSHFSIRVEWGADETAQSSPLWALFNPTETASAPDEPVEDSWTYQGSGFDAEGFLATRHGEIISLGQNHTALICGPRASQGNQSFEVRNTALLPKPGTSATIVVQYPSIPANDSARDATVTSDWLDQLASAGKDIHLTLPDGTIIGGTIETLNRSGGMAARVSGRIHHPEPGEFDFARVTSGDNAPALNGTLRIDSQATEWALEPAPHHPGRFVLTKRPSADGFRPRNQQLPDRISASAGTQENIRTQGEEKLRKVSAPKELAPGKLRFGEVEVWKDSGCIRIPVTLAEREKVIEYVLVTSTGKAHESLLTTTAEPADVYLALLEVGLVPVPCANNRELEARIGSIARIDIEWHGSAARPIVDFLRLAPADPAGGSLPDRMWHFNGSRFSQSSFAAKLEGSLVSLVADDLALINNPGPDRVNDDSHFPASALLPDKGTTGTLVISKPLPSSKPKPIITNP